MSRLPPRPAPFPDPLAEARATVLDPASVNLQPALMADAWARLKEARGQPLARPHLLAPAHVIRATSQTGMPRIGTVAAIDAARGRVSERIRSMFAAPAPGGDAA